MFVGGNHRLFRRWVDDVWKIPTDHLDPNATSRELSRRGARPLEALPVKWVRQYRREAEQDAADAA